VMKQYILSKGPKKECVGEVWLSFAEVGLSIADPPAAPP
jgi:hypothetical protein